MRKIFVLFMLSGFCPGDEESVAPVVGTVVNAAVDPVVGTVVNAAVDPVVGTVVNAAVAPVVGTVVNAAVDPAAVADPATVVNVDPAAVADLFEITVDDYARDIRRLYTGLNDEAVNELAQVMRRRDFPLMLGALVDTNTRLREENDDFQKAVSFIGASIQKGAEFLKQIGAKKVTNAIAVLANGAAGIANIAQARDGTDVAIGGVQLAAAVASGTAAARN